MKAINSQMCLMQQKQYNQIEALLDVAAHFEHRLLIRCDI
jgi:hypothetical protein